MEPGSSLRAYFDRCETYCKAAGVTADEDCITVFKNGLGSADYGKFCIDTTLPTKYSDFRTSLLLLHEPEEPQAVSKDKFFTARQLPQERIRQFCERLKRLSHRAYGTTLSDSARLTLVKDSFCRGLRSARVKEAAALSPITNLDDLLIDLERHETIALLDAGVSAVSERPTEPTAESRLDRLSEIVEQLALTVAKMSTQPERERVERRTCFNCGNRGKFLLR